MILIILITLLIAVLVILLPPLVLIFGFRSTQYQNISTFPVDSTEQDAVWVTNVSTTWHDSIDIKVNANTSSIVKNTFTVYPIQLTTYLALARSTINQSCIHMTNLSSNLTSSSVQRYNNVSSVECTAIPGTRGQAVCSFWAPLYNMSSQKLYLDEGAKFTHAFCAENPMHDIDIWVHIFSISTDKDYESYVNYTQSGDSRTALHSASTTVNNGLRGCVQLNTTILKSTYYYVVTSILPSKMSSLSDILNSTIFINVTVSCNSSWQFKHINTFTYTRCQVTGNDACHIPLRGGARPRNYVVLVDYNGNAHLEHKVNRNKNDVAIAVACGLVLAVGVIIFGVISYKKCYT